MNIFQHVQYRRNNFEIISELFRRLKIFYLSFRRGYIWNKTVFYLTCNQSFSTVHWVMVRDSVSDIIGPVCCWYINYQLGELGL